MSDTLTLLSKVLPQLAIIAVLCGFIGWSLRGRPAKAAPAKSSTPIADKGQQDRAKNLEAALEKSKAAHKALKAELENLQSGSVSKATFDSTTAELAAARSALDTETKRISTLETDLKKAQDTAKQLNARLNDGEKAQKERNFALENELSKTREQLAVLQNRPDDSAELHAEIERLRESVAVSSRFAGEVRKREAAAIEALEKAEAKLADLSDPSRPAPVSKKIGPVIESDRIAAAKAEVIRLVEMNKQKEAAAAVVAVEEPTVIVEETIVVVEEIPVAVEETTADTNTPTDELSPLA
jgi:chromosome segregation ATPase